MYKDEGYLKPLTEVEAKKQLAELFGEGNDDATRIFQVGQVLQVNGGWFRVKNIKPKELRLKVIPKPAE